jgi:hypothetical protein
MNDGDTHELGPFGGTVNESTNVGIGLSAAVVAIEGDAPMILVAQGGDGQAGLPSGAFDPARHRTLDR